MKVVLDANVVVSGIFWGGPPQKYLEAAAGGRVQALVSGDKDLAVLRVIDGIPILTPRAFLLGRKNQ